jgi:hypothetical protein
MRFLHYLFNKISQWLLYSVMALFVAGPFIYPIIGDEMAGLIFKFYIVPFFVGGAISVLISRIRNYNENVFPGWGMAVFMCIFAGAMVWISYFK